MIRKFIVVVLLILAFTINAFCCGGSCLKCHPDLNLEKPKQHKIIKDCINCHKKGCGKQEEDLLGDSGSNACGQDCFQCHTVLPDDNEHKLLSECVKCHKTVNINHD